MQFFSTNSGIYPTKKKILPQNVFGVLDIVDVRKRYVGYVLTWDNDLRKNTRRT
jgi:hypothetical protein